jgi:hypothetical protein
LRVEALDRLVTLRGASLEGLDCTDAELRSLRLMDCQITDCRFDRANCKDWRLWSSVVQRASFCDADLSEAALGTWQDGTGNVWRQVDFTRTKLRGVTLIAAVFDECSFIDTVLDGSQFNQCSLTACCFVGQLRDVLFDGRGVPRVPAPAELACDFSQAMFENVEFRGFSLDDVVLPDDPDVMLVRNWPCVARWIADALGQDQAVACRQLRGVVNGALRMLDAATPPVPHAGAVLNRRDWREWGGPELEELGTRLVEDALAACES